MSYEDWKAKRDAKAAAAGPTAEEWQAAAAAMGVKEESDDQPAAPKSAEEEIRELRGQVQQLTAIAQRQLDQQAPKLTRSKMSTAEKAKFIGEHGKAAYFQLPWS